MMECRLVEEKIEAFVYDKTIRPDEEMIEHIAGCTACKTYLKSCQRAQKIIANLSRAEPVITFPQQLTNDIMALIDEPVLKTSHHQTRFLAVARKFLVAASVALFIVFSGEQYIFVDKLMKLEKNLTATPNNKQGAGVYKKMISYYPEKGLQMVKSELARQVPESKQMDFKSLIMMAGYSVLAGEELANQVKNQTSSKQNLSGEMIKHH